MDPNAALNNIREAVGELRNQDDDGVLDGTSQVGFLLESIEALDEWLTKGGFLPEAWGKPRCHHAPGPNQPGSIGITGPDGRMVWHFKDEGETP